MQLYRKKGMHQGLAFHKLGWLLKIFKFFNGNVVEVTIVLYASHHSHTGKQ